MEQDAGDGVVTARRQPGLRWALAALCVTVITSYGVLFYAFPVLAPSISADTGWPTVTVTAAFSLGQIVAAVAGIPVGHLVDRHGPRVIMTAGSVLAVPATLAVAAAPSPAAFAGAWAVAGVAMAATFYPPAFTALTRWYGPDRVRALTVLTLVAGVSSTIFAPLTAALDTGLGGWRPAYMVLAGILAVVTVPLHAVALRPAWPSAAGPDPARAVSASAAGGTLAVIRSRAFLALLATMVLAAFCVYGVVVHQVPLLAKRGLSAQTAAWALGLGGLGQVMGRILYGPMVGRRGLVARTAAVTAACALTAGLLGVLPGPAVALLAASVLAGMARGMFTLLHATAVSDRWGAAAYGRLTGILSAPITAAIALAPWSGAAIAAALGGYPDLFEVMAAACLAGAVLAAWTRPEPPPGRDATRRQPPGRPV